MAEETTMESIADEAPAESIADETPVEASETAQDVQEGAPAQDIAPAAEGAPDGKESAQEDYKLEAGEDFNIPSENLDSFTQACKQAGLSKAQAEAMLAWHKSFAGDVAKYQTQQQEQQVKAWQTEILQDKEFGGTSWKATVADSRKALAAFDTDGSLRKLLREAHVDYHPAVVRCIARVGRAMGEDKFISSKGSGNDVRALEDRMWPNMHV